MPNEEYQRLLRADAPELRERLEVDTHELEDQDLLATFRDLGGHDLGALIDAYRQADAERSRPTVVFAYTIKGWSLPTEGHPANHSALLNPEQFADLAAQLGTDPDDPWAGFDHTSPEAELCAAAAQRLRAAAARAGGAPPAGPGRPRPRAQGRRSPPSRRSGASSSTSSREAPDVAERVVTVSPDVGTSTNLGGWINKVGHLGARRPDRLVRRRHRHARPLAGDRPRPPHRARDRRGEPRRAARRARAPRGRATASRCCRWARSTTRSCRARSSRGRSASTRAASRSSSARRAASRSAPRAAPTSR